MLKKILPYIVIIILVVLIRTFIVTPIRVNGFSMFPHIKEKEVMFLVKVTKYLKDYQRFNIIVLKENDEYLIKRIIALPGEKISCQNGTIYIDDKILIDNYGVGKTNDFEEITLDENSYFVMGDNREISKDSREIGSIKEKDILGYANSVIYPFNKIRIVD